MAERYSFIELQSVIYRHDLSGDAPRSYATATWKVAAPDLEEGAEGLIKIEVDCTDNLDGAPKAAGSAFHQLLADLATATAHW